MIVVWLLLALLGVAAIVWGAETFAEHLPVASARLGVSAFALAVLLAGAEPRGAGDRGDSVVARRTGDRDR